MTNEFHGILLIDKPVDMTSHDVVDRVRGLLRQRSVGHAGTLDPMASGLMVLLVGQGTKLSEFILTGDKGYEVTIRLGLRTDTLDCTGQVLSRETVSLDPEWIRSQAETLQGELELPVPLFSAMKVKGERLYQIAREGRSIERPMKRMSFYALEFLEVGKDFLRVRFKCSKGSYVRSWAEALGQLLGVGATVEQLKRTWSAPYNLSQAAGLEKLAVWSESLRAQNNIAEEGSFFVPLSQTLPESPALTINGKDERLMRNGQISHELTRRLIGQQKSVNQSQKPLVIKVMAPSGNLLSILEAQPFKSLKIRRNFILGEREC